MTDIINAFTHVREQLPDYIKNNFDDFIAFIEAYYEWLETENQPTWLLHSTEDAININNSLTSFIEKLREEFLHLIPVNALVDDVTLIKNIKDFYLSRGSEKSFKFLFRILFDEDVNFYYPKNDILKASDGKWIKDTNLFIEQIGSDDPFDFSLKNVTGETSGATAFVDIVTFNQQGSYEVYRLDLLSFSGEFTIGERVYYENDDGIRKYARILGFVSSIDIETPGNSYEIGNFLPVIDGTGNGINAIAQISEVESSGSIESFSVANGGSGYRVGDPVIFDERETGGFGAIAEVGSIRLEEIQEIDITIIADHRGVIIDTIDEIVIEDYLDYETFQLGSVTSILVKNGGRDYSNLPVVSIGQKQPSYSLIHGSGALITPIVGDAGKIKKISIIDPGVGYINDNTWPQVNLTNIGNGLGDAQVNVSGGPYISEGFWADDSGHLSSSKKLQDNYFYQLYSYVLQVNEVLDNYETIVNEILHPAGFKLFGELLIENIVNTRIAPIDSPLDPDLSYLKIVNDSTVAQTVSVAESDLTILTDETHEPLEKLELSVYIFNYAADTIDDFDEVVLIDFPGFTPRRTEFAWSSEITEVT